MDELYQIGLQFIEFKIKKHNILQIENSNVNNKNKSNFIEIAQYMLTNDKTQYFDTDNSLYCRLIFKNTNEYVLFAQHLEYFMDFIGDIRHDIKNYTGAIKEFGNLLLKEHVVPALNDISNELNNENVISKI